MENGWIFVACRVFAPKGTLIYHRKRGEGAEGRSTRIRVRGSAGGGGVRNPCILSEGWWLFARPARRVIRDSIYASEFKHFILTPTVQQPAIEHWNPEPGIEGKKERLEHRGAEGNSNHDPTRLLPH